MIILIRTFTELMWISQGYSSQHYLLAMLENFKKSANDGNEFGALLTNPSKEFDCIDYKLLIAKLFCSEFHPQLLI